MREEELEMRKKFKIFIGIALVLIITGACIVAGFHTRHINAIVVTQFGQDGNRSMGYMLKTKENRLILIDGGLPEYSNHIIDVIKQNGGVVEAWFITHAHVDHASVLLDALKDSQIQINNIYVSLNGKDWYEQYEENQGRIDFAIELIDTLAEENIKDRVHEVSLREEFNIDNLNFKILKIKNPKFIENAGNNQSVVIKVSNTYKSLLFLGDLGEEYQEDFINDNQDEIKCDAVQMAHHGQHAVNKEVYEKIDPDICFWPTPEWLWENEPGDGKYGSGNWETPITRQWIEELGVKENYVAAYGDITVEL